MGRLVAYGNPWLPKRIDVDTGLSVAGLLGRHSGQLATIRWHLISIEFVGNPMVVADPANPTATNRSPLIDWAAIGDPNLIRCTRWTTHIRTLTTAFTAANFQNNNKPNHYM